MKRHLHAVVTGLAVFVSAPLSGAQQPGRLERDTASTMLPARPATDSAQGATVAASGCLLGEIPDCNGTCAPAFWLGDGICDNGAFPWPAVGGTPIFFNCDAFSCDGGDCLPKQCISSVCGNGVIEPGETCDDGNTTPGDGCSATCQTEGGPPTYSVHHMVGEPDPLSGQTTCFRTTFVPLPGEPPPGEPDDIVTFDGLPENLATDLNGVVASVTESETNNVDGTVSVSITTSSPLSTDLFPGGFVNPETEAPLTEICWFIGIDQTLDLTPAPTVSSATLSFTKDGVTIVGPFDLPLAFFTDPWDGFLGLGLPDTAGLFINGVQLDLVFAASACGNGACDAGETCASCPADCGVCPGSCPGAGECCVNNGSPGCEDTSCCEAVCAADAFCCGDDDESVGVWDDLCAEAAMALCPGIPSCPIACPGTGDCCAVHPELGCSDSACCSSVCDVDSFCCAVSWDEVCVEEASILCGTCTTGACCWDSACETPGTCEAPVLCAAGCECFELAAGGGGGCTEFIDDCTATVSCPNGSQDCPAGEQCYINTCCDGPVCGLDCALGGAAAASVEGLTGQGSRATRVHAGAASRGSVISCTDSTEVYCTAFGGAYKGDASLCSDVDVCAAACPQLANIDLAALALTDYPCDATLSRNGNNVLRFEFDIPVVAPLAGEIEINELQGPGVYGRDLSASFNITVENGNVLKITEIGKVLSNETWYAVRNVGNWCDAGNFEVDYAVVYGDVDGFGGTSFGDLAAIFNVLQNGLPLGSLEDSSRFDIDGFGGISFGDIAAAFNSNNSSAGAKPSPGGCSP